MANRKSFGFIYGPIYVLSLIAIIIIDCLAVE